VWSLRDPLPGARIALGRLLTFRAGTARNR
jgi:hypothetical protein